MATRNSRSTTRVAAVALLLLPPFLLLAMTVSLASAARPAATRSPQPVAPAQVATTDVEPGEVSVAAGIGMLLVTKASPSEAPPSIETSVVFSPPLQFFLLFFPIS
jgi:hypothetical protein